MKTNNDMCTLGKNLGTTWPSRLRRTVFLSSFFFFRRKQDGENKLASCFPHPQHWCDLCSVLPSFSLSTATCPCILFAPVALGCTVRWLCPGPYSWDLRKPKKRRRGNWRHQRAGQIPAVPKSGCGTRTCWRGEGTALLLPMSVSRRMRFPVQQTGCSWNNAIKCNAGCATEHVPLGQQEAKRSNVSWVS